MNDARDALLVGRRTDGSTVSRPMSPHLQVYRPQLTSVLSALNRITGVGSSIGVLLMVWWLVTSAGSPGAYGAMQTVMGSWIGLFLLFCWTAALMYHFFAGLRHLAWDAGYGFDLPQVYASGWATVAATGLSTVAIWVAVLVVWR